MASTTDSAGWLTGPSQRRLREISSTAASRLPYSEDFASCIESDITAIYRLAIDFKRESNNYKSPILRLSSEMICEIIACIAALEPANTKSLGWIRVGHISYRFRLLLLSMRWLWASVICDVGPRAWDEVLGRAGNAPPTLKLDDANEVLASSRINYVIDNMTRARRLTITEYDPTVAMWVNSPREISGTVFADLEDLNVEAMHRPSRDLTWLATDVYELNPISAPKLRSVSLTNVYIPFPPENLTTLTLKRLQFYADKPLPNGDDILPAPEVFLALLKRCVNVERLCLTHVIPDISALPSRLHPSHSIRLPSLTSLTLDAKLSRLLALWSHLSVPPDTTIKFGADFTSFPATSELLIDEGRLSVFPSLSDHIARSNLSEVTALYIGNENTKERTTCALFKRNHAFVSETWEGLPVLGQPHAYTDFVDVRFDQCLWGADVTLPRLIASLPPPIFATIDTLQVQDIPGATLACLLACLPHLHTLRLADLDRACLAALSPFANFAKSPRSLSAPSLRHLHLSKFKLCVESSRSSSYIPCVRDFLDVMGSRSTACGPLHTLVFDDLTSDLDAFQLVSFTTQLEVTALVFDVRFAGHCLKI
ncbi:hypothetical protein PENSPDRAFT_760278 [Peniophora sp. CONT]|nr:hypothetical protein PENSPDRAFT_760278 [Peniophora sp. CONT]